MASTIKVDQIETVAGSGNITFGNGINLNGQTLSGTSTFSGTTTFSGTSTFSGSVELPSDVDINPVYATGNLGSSFALGEGAWTKVTGFTQNETDTDTAFDGTTFTVPTGKGGIYLCYASLEFWFASDGNDPRNTSIRWYVGGSASNYYVRPWYSSGGTAAYVSGLNQQITSMIDLNAGDTLEVYAYQDNTNGNDITIENGIQSRFAVLRLTGEV